MDENINSTLETQSIGQILVSARERKGMTVKEIADSLRLSVQMIQAIESDQFERFPAVIYLKGYLRSYAKLVELSEEAFLQMYSQVKVPDDVETLATSVKMTPVIKYSQASRKKNHLFFRISFLVVLSVVAILFYAHFRSHSLQNNTVLSMAAFDPHKGSAVTIPLTGQVGRSMTMSTSKPVKNHRAFPVTKVRGLASRRSHLTRQRTSDPDRVL